MTSKTLTFKKIWETLSKIDCTNHIEKKMNLSYLSWAWAWGILMENYPEAEISFYEHTETRVPYVELPDGTAEVRCYVAIEGLQREMWLPVMDHRNNAVKHPTARQVSDTKMRCLVKCLALYGLGHYIYAGEDLPITNDEPKVEEKTESLQKELKDAEKAAEGGMDDFKKYIDTLDGSIRESLRPQLTKLWNGLARPAE